MTGATLVALIAAIAGPAVAYLAAAKRFSGSIEHSDATDLWEESRQIRDWSERQIESLRGRLAGLEKENEELKVSLRRAQRRIDELEEGTR